MQNPGGGGYNTGGQQGQGGGGGQPPQQQQSGGKPTGMYGYPHGGMQQNMPMHGGGGAGGGKPQTQHGMGGGMPSQQQHQQQQQSQQQQYPGPGGGGSGSGTAPGIMPGMNPAQQMYPSGSMQPRGGGAGPGGPGGYPGQTPYHHYMPGGMSGGPGSGYPTGQYGSQQQGAQQQQQPMGTTSGMPPQYPAGSQGVPPMAGQQQRGGGMAGTMSGQESGMNPAAQYNVGHSGGGHLPATGYSTSAAAPPTNPMQATVKTEPLQQQHAQHAPTSAPSTAAYAAPPQYMPHPMQQMPQHPMFHPGPPGAQTHAQTREELKRAMTPSPYPESILNNLKIYNVANLCTIGRELVHELNVRTSLLCSSLKQISEKRSTVPSTGDPEVILEYCQHILKKLLEIRLRIEKLAPGTRMDPEDFIERMTDMTPPEKPEMLAKEEERFETHRRKLVALNADMKLLDWMASVDDPHYLKKTDRQIEKS